MAEERTDFEAALNAGAALGQPQVIPAGDITYAVIPEGYTIQSLESYLPRPIRTKAQVVLTDTDSFIEYVKIYGGEETRLFFFAETENFEAVIDYHTSAVPGWSQHVALYKPVRSVEFATWMGANRKQMSQVEFARFLEDNLPDIVTPPGAELLAVALTMEAKKEVSFSSGVRLQTGQIQFTYNEEVRGTAQVGTLEIPEKFVLGIPIHQNGPGYRIDVRLRWRLHEQKLAFWYEIVRPHRYIEDAIKEIRHKIETDASYAILSGRLAR